MFGVKREQGGVSLEDGASWFGAEVGFVLHFSVNSNVCEKLLRQQSQPRLSMEGGASCHPVKQKHLLNVRALK